MIKLNLQIKNLRKSLENKAKKDKVNYKKYQNTIKHLRDENLNTISLPMNDYNNNVTKISKDSNNKRTQLYPLSKINLFISLTSDNNNSLSSFAVIWNEKKDIVEGGLYNFHIYYDPEESDAITFTAYYSQIKNRDVKNKSMKIYQTEFTFDDEQVIRMKNSETTKESTMKSIGYVFLTLYCMYMEKNGSFDDEDFVEFFKSYSNLKRQDSKDYNFGKSFDLLSSDNLDKKDDKNLISINYK